MDEKLSHAGMRTRKSAGFLRAVVRGHGRVLHGFGQAGAGAFGQVRPVGQLGRKEQVLPARDFQGFGDALDGVLREAFVVLKAAHGGVINGRVALLGQLAHGPAERVAQAMNIHPRRVFDGVGVNGRSLHGARWILRDSQAMSERTYSSKHRKFCFTKINPVHG